MHPPTHSSHPALHDTHTAPHLHPPFPTTPLAEDDTTIGQNPTRGRETPSLRSHYRVFVLFDAWTPPSMPCMPSLTRITAQHITARHCAPCVLTTREARTRAPRITNPYLFTLENCQRPCGSEDHSAIMKGLHGALGPCVNSPRCLPAFASVRLHCTAPHCTPVHPSCPHHSGRGVWPGRSENRPIPGKFPRPL